MALFKIFKGRSEDLGKTGGTNFTKEGYAYFTPDDGKFYIDITEGDTPIVGSSQSMGANRICINSGIFGNNVILDCGTAEGWININQVIYFDAGDADLLDEADAIFYDLNVAYDNTEVPIYDAGSSWQVI